MAEHTGATDHAGKPSDGEGSEHTRDPNLRWPLLEPLETLWSPWHSAPDAVAIVTSYTSMFAATAANDLVYLPLDAISAAAGWSRAGHANNVVTMTNLNGTLYCITDDGTVWMRLPFLEEINWAAIGEVPRQLVALAGYAGKLFLATEDNALYWRDAVGARTPPAEGEHPKPWVYLSQIPGHGMEADLDASGLDYAVKLLVPGDFDGGGRDELALVPDVVGTSDSDLWITSFSV